MADPLPLARVFPVWRGDPRKYNWQRVSDTRLLAQALALDTWEGTRDGVATDRFLNDFGRLAALYVVHDCDDALSHVADHRYDRLAIFHERAARRWRCEIEGGTETEGDEPDPWDTDGEDAGPWAFRGPQVAILRALLHWGGDDGLPDPPPPIWMPCAPVLSRYEIVGEIDTDCRSVRPEDGDDLRDVLDHIGSGVTVRVTVEIIAGPEPDDTTPND